MVKKFGNSTDDSNEGGLGRYENVGPSIAPIRDTDSSDDEEDPEEDVDGTKTLNRV